MWLLVFFLSTLRGQELPELGHTVSSFLQTQNKLSLKDTLLLQEYEKVKNLNKDLLTVMEYHTLKRKVRRTQKGEICSASFTYNNKHYTDCTQEQSPDGQVTFQPWCMEQEAEKDESKWGFCQDTVDYDDIRKKVKFLINSMIPQILSIKEEQMKLIPQGQKLIENYDKEDYEQSQINNKLQGKPFISELRSNIDNLQNIYSTLHDFQTRWEELERKTEVLDQELQNLSKKNIDQIPENCEGIQGYEEDQNGEGLITYYYDNENFDGDSLQDTNSNIDFQWNGQAPFKNINSENYSIKLTGKSYNQGFLKVPVTSEYTFKLECDDGCSMFLNEHPIMSKNFDLQDPTKPLNTTNARQKQKGVRSEALYLIGGQKYAISLQIYHSQENNYEMTSDTFTKLYWSCEYFQDQIVKIFIQVPKISLYRTNKMPPLKISDYYHNQMELTQLVNFMQAYSDSQQYIIDDVPLLFLNHNLLQFKSVYLEKSISFKLSARASVYIAIDENKVNPLPPDFLDTNQVMSVLKVNLNKDSTDKNTKAFFSYPFRIYENSFPAGLVDIPLNLNAKNQQFILFYSLNTQTQKEAICGGHERIISVPNTESFESCSASSQHPSNQYNCTHGLSGSMLNTPYTTWISNNEALGAYLRLKFSRAYKITKIEYKNLESLSARAKELTFEFQNKESHTLEVKNTDKTTIFLPNPPILSNDLKMTISSVYSSQSNGGALNVYGVPCELPSQSLSQTIFLSCENSLQNHQIIRNLSIEDSFYFKCGTCLEGTLFGTGVYSLDSSICLALYHDKGETEGQAKIIPFDADYQSSLQNGIRSQQRKGGGKSFTFVEYQKNYEAFMGQQVDIRDFTLKRWVPGTITKVEKGKVKVSKDGYSQDYDRFVPWYDPSVVDYCGEKIKDRNCHFQSRKPGKESQNLAIKICFTPKSDCPSTYIVDRGDVYQDKGELTFGWSYQQSSMARSRGLNADPLLDNFILFPPDIQSQWCVKNQQVSCQPNEWKIKVPVGTYNVKITSGDPQSNFGVGIQANDLYVITPQILRKNQFFTNSKIIVSLDGFIKINARCEQNCQNYWSRINAIEITRYLDTVDNGISTEQTAALGCGNAYQGIFCNLGGRCIVGPNTENCVYQNTSDPGAEKCNQQSHLVKIPENYQCVNQRQNYKCIKDYFETTQECVITCPGQCRLNTCMVPNFVFN